MLNGLALFFDKKRKGKVMEITMEKFIERRDNYEFKNIENLNLKEYKNIKLHNMAVIGENRATAYTRASKNIGGHSTLFENEDSYKSEKRYRELIFEKDRKSGTTIHDDLPEQI